MASASKYHVVCFGEVLWDILPATELPGGAPMNVAYHLKKLGVEPALITRVGKDDYGVRLLQMLADSHLATDYIGTDPEHHTGLVHANISDTGEVTYEIAFPSAWDFIDVTAEHERLVAAAPYFLYGSLSSRHHVSARSLATLLQAAQTKVFDINLRKPHYQPSLIEQLMMQADIVKMNDAELDLVSSWYTPLVRREDQVRSLQERFDIDTLIVTLGAKGAMVCSQGSVVTHTGYKVEVVDTIGSGDAFLAGFLYRHMNGDAPAKALEFACALGAFVATRAGACPAYQLSDIRQTIDTAKKVDS